MNQQTAQLLYLVKISAARLYLHFITETDEDTLIRWADNYHTDDVQVWAKEKIAEPLAGAAQLKTRFNFTLPQRVRRHIKQLKQAGFECQNTTEGTK